jgi:hypothetical protein
MSAAPPTLDAMTSWDRSRVLELAPDAGSRTAAVGLAGASSWTAVGRADSGSGTEVLWGQCQGSGRTPYLTAVVVDDPPAFSCTCPSRKFPCKHAVALLLRWSAGQLAGGEPPEYVAQWQQRRIDRTTRNETPVRPAGELADPEGAAKRSAARVERVATGLIELDQWLHDQIRGGLAGLDRAGYAPFETMAARMIDAQAPGVASSLRSLPGEIAAGTADGSWPARLLDQLGLLYLLVEAHRSLDRLDPALAATVRSRIGYPVSKDEVLAGPAIEDHWVGVGMVDTIEYRLETRRVWLYGADSGRWASLLSFAPPGGSLPADVVAGDHVRAALHFYPGSGQFRALVGRRTSTVQPPRYPAPESLGETQQRFAALLAADPWATRMPAAVSVAPIPPVRAGEPWRLRDADGASCEVIGLPGDPWPLLACSAGEPIGLSGEWSPRGFRPLSVLPGGPVPEFATTLLGLAA